MERGKRRCWMLGLKEEGEGDREMLEAGEERI